MKVKVKEESKEFRPVTMEITFESREELVQVWNALNCSIGELQEMSERYDTHPMKRNSPNLKQQLWRSVDSILENL